MPRDPISNPYGVGFESHTTPVTHEAAFNLDWETNRGEHLSALGISTLLLTYEPP
jgi:hypothetical protein